MAAHAQVPAAPTPSPAPIAAPEGYILHQSVDMGGHIVNRSGSQSMYATLVNQQSGPRILGQTFDLRLLPGKKGTFLDVLSGVVSGFGGDSNNYARLNASRAKDWEFTGVFRRDRQYFDYDLLNNPNIVASTMNIGASNAPTATFAWPQVNQSPVLFNTVRRMTDSDLTVRPLDKWSYTAGYSQNVFEGPTLSPSYSIAKYDALLEQYQRNSSDEFRAGVTWKPIHDTRVSAEAEVVRYKADSYFTLAPNQYLAQEADGTKVNLGNWDSQTPYGIGACNTLSMGTAYTSSTVYTIFSAPNATGGLPIINPACDVVTSYMRSQPTRILTPTGLLRLQSSAVRNVAMNGVVRYTLATAKMPAYYENVTGLDATVRQITYNGLSRGHRAVVGIDYGIVYQAMKTVSLADQVDISLQQQPGHSYIPAAATLNTPTDTKTSNGFETINYAGKLTAGTFALPHGINGTDTPNFFGQSVITNNATVAWDATEKVRVSFTYRYGSHTISQGIPHNIDIPTALADPVNGNVTINENAGIFHVAVRPNKAWEANGSVEIGYADNVFTSVAPRQTRRYRAHAKYRPLPWTTFNLAISDLEKHNNTANNAAAVAAGTPWEGALNHVDSSRNFSLGAVLAPNEHYGADVTVAYSDIFSATNICYNNGASATTPGTASLSAAGTPNVCPGVYARGSTTVLSDWWGRDFQEAPTTFVSAALLWSPNKTLHANLGYRVSNVRGNQFFNDARAVNGSMYSMYQMPFAKVDWTMHPGLTWKAEYNLYSYGEGGSNYAQNCSTTTSTSSTVSPCSSFSQPTGATEGLSGLAPGRNFHSNNVTMGFHYEF